MSIVFDGAKAANVACHGLADVDNLAEEVGCLPMVLSPCPLS